MSNVESNTEQEREAIQISIQQAEAMVAKGDKVRELLEDEKFKDIILDDYMDTNVSRLAKLSTDSNLGSNITENQAMRADIYESIAATGHLRDFLNAIMSQANGARNSLETNKQELEELDSEEDSE